MTLHGRIGGNILGMQLESAFLTSDLKRFTIYMEVELVNDIMRCYSDIHSQPQLLPLKYVDHIYFRSSDVLKTLLVYIYAIDLQKTQATTRSDLGEINEKSISSPM